MQDSKIVSANSKGKYHYHQIDFPCPSSLSMFPSILSVEALLQLLGMIQDFLGKPLLLPNRESLLWPGGPQTSPPSCRSVGLDVDYFLHNKCHSFLKNNIKILQENPSESSK